MSSQKKKNVKRGQTRINHELINFPTSIYLLTRTLTLEPAPDGIRNRLRKTTGKQPQALAGQSSTTYNNNFSLHAVGAYSWRPQVQQKPLMDGPQIAHIVSPPNEEIYCDERPGQGAVRLGSGGKTQQARQLLDPRQPGRGWLTRHGSFPHRPQPQGGGRQE
ncbi:MAG: hypothetical protein L3J88_11655 [Gammaproteobacteria bacterium]|nr:hypothetical protein [Gammaproteobacteria bacterium]MCF6363973.1 hypothetical protein [Gammaproteobacteria bacterium]